MPHGAETTPKRIPSLRCGAYFRDFTFWGCGVCSCVTSKVDFSLLEIVLRFGGMIVCFEYLVSYLTCFMGVIFYFSLCICM